MCNSRVWSKSPAAPCPRGRRHHTKTPASLGSSLGHRHVQAPGAVSVFHPCCLRCLCFPLRLCACAGPVRAAILGASLVTYLGIMKVNLAGPGLTETVKTLWRKPQPAAA